MLYDEHNDFFFFSFSDTFSNVTNSKEPFSSSINSEESFNNAPNLEDSARNATNLVTSSWDTFPYIIQNGTEAKVEHGVKSKLNKVKDKITNKVKEGLNKVKEVGKKIKNYINKDKDKSKDVGKDYNKIGNRDTSGNRVNKDIGSNYNKVKNKDTYWQHRDRYKNRDNTGNYSSSSNMPAMLWIIFGIIGISILIGVIYVCVK